MGDLDDIMNNALAAASSPDRDDRIAASHAQSAKTSRLEALQLNKTQNSVSEHSERVDDEVGCKYRCVRRSIVREDAVTNSKQVRQWSQSIYFVLLPIFMSI